MIRPILVVLTVSSLVACNRGGSKGSAQPRPAKAPATATSAPAPQQRAQLGQVSITPGQEKVELGQATITGGAPVAVTKPGGPYIARTGADRHAGGVAVSESSVAATAAGSRAGGQAAESTAYARTENLVLPENRRAGGAVSTAQAPVYARAESLNLPQATAADLRAGNQGPGWPANYAPSQQPIYSGRVDARGNAFTDGKDDSIMAAMVEKMNSLPENIREASIEFSQAINSIDLAVDRQAVNLELGFKFSDGEFREGFSGFLQNGRSTTLTQRTANSGHQFRVQITCADVDTNCRNVVLTIDHILNGELCRRVYAVHRWMMDGAGDGHFTLGQDDYSKSAAIYAEDKDIQRLKKAGGAVKKDVLIKNRAQRAFLRMVGNTVHYNRMMNNEAPREASRTPRLEFLGVRSWAVAYGRSGFEISMSKMKVGAGVGSTTRFVGALTKPRVAGEVSEELSVIGDGYADAVVDEFNDERFAQNIAQALLIDNDGRGNLTLHLDFYGETEEGGVRTTRTTGAVRINFTGLNIPALSLNELRQVLP